MRSTERVKAFIAFTASAALTAPALAQAQQAPWAAPDLPLSHADRVYAAEQFSNTVSVTDPVDNRLLGVIRLGDPQPANFSPLYKGQLLVHGLGFSPDGGTLAVVSIGSNSVTFIDTATNAVRHTTYIGRSPHEAFYTPDGSEVWVTVRGEDYVSILSAKNFAEIARLKTPSGPGMTIFSPDGKYGYVCSSFTPQLTIFEVGQRKIVASLPQPSPFCPNIAASPDGKQIWYTLKDTGKVVAFQARPPFATLKILDTGPITNHVNFAVTPRGQFAYVSVGGLNEIKVFRTTDFSQVASIAVGKLPHGVWPSGDGSRIYVGLENDDKLAVIDTATNVVTALVPIGQAPQAIAFVPKVGRGAPTTDNLQPLNVAGNVFPLILAPPGGQGAPSSISLFDQGLIQILQGAVSDLKPQQTYVLALSATATGAGDLEPIVAFRTNAAGAAVINSAGPLRQIVQPGNAAARRWLVIAETDSGGSAPAKIVQVQTGD